MTLHEIEETLATLSSRHHGLDEGMLVTLLLAGGWEEKDIEEAKLLFKNQHLPSKNEIQEQGTFLPALEDEPLLEPEVDADHRLLEHNPETQEVPEPVSLVQEAPYTHKDDLPHNLPLRPFETSEHIWPFSRYRDVFYGEEEGETKSKPPTKAQEAHQQPIIIEPSQPTPVMQAPEIPKVQPISFRPSQASPGKPSASKATAKREEGLVVTATVMLLMILFLLGYMYSNGRL